MESWQSGNAPDSKSGEPVSNRRAGSNPVLSLNEFYDDWKNQLIVIISWFFFVNMNYF